MNSIRNGFVCTYFACIWCTQNYPYGIVLRTIHIHAKSRFVQLKIGYSTPGVARCEQGIAGPGRKG